MQKNIVDIFHIKKKGNNILECNNFTKLNNIANNYKKVSDITQKVYVYNNLYLIINLNDNGKKCELIENYENKINGDLLISKMTMKELDLNSFPFIDKYHDIIERYTIEYQNGISIIKEISSKSKETITFVRVESQEVDKIINFIK